MASYKKILYVLRDLTPKESFLIQKRKPKLKDIELIALNLTAEYLSIDSECQLFRILPNNLKSKIERSVYNRRKRKLFPFIEEIRKKISDQFTEFENYYIVDSMPLEVAKLSRSSTGTVCKESYHSAPSKGYCSGQKFYFYGYKLHAVCSIEGVFKSFDLSKASVHDIHYLKDIKQQFSHCVIIGDKGYLRVDYQADLFETNRIKLEVPMRKNQEQFKNKPIFSGKNASE